MIKSRYILTLLAMLLSMVARGQDFNPDSPPEPGARYKLTVKAQPAEAATVSGGGLYAVNANVNVKAVARNANWRFKNWTDAEGKVVSTSSSFTHRKLNSAETLTANYEYQKTSRLTIAYDPSSIRASEVKEYVVGVTYSFTASTYSDYTFVNWTTSDGTVISTNRAVSYTVTENDETITAHYRFTPGSPAEPNETKPKHKVYFRCDPAGLAGFNKTSGFSVSEGSPYSVTVYSVNDYEFKGWTWEGETKILETSRTWNVNMGTRDAHLVAHFEFKPSSPSEPSTDTKQRHSLYATTTSMYRGETTLLPIYMQNTGNVKTLSFKLHLPKNLTVDVANIQKTLRTDAYTVQAAQEDSVLSVSLEGGTQIVEHDGVVVRIPVSAQEALKDSVYTVKFSDIAGTTTADAVINFTSRSGRLVVSTPEEGDLQAKFSVETYMNRAQFTNLSSENAKTFEWNFGDGATSTERNPMHSYAEDQNVEYWNMRTDKEAEFNESTVPDRLEGSMEFLGKIGKKGIEDRKSKKGKDFQTFSAFSSDKNGENREFTWVNFVVLNPIHADYFAAEKYVEVHGDLRLNVYKSNLHIECSVKSVAAWDVSKKEDGTAAQA